jgi:hypothetical protein
MKAKKTFLILAALITSSALIAGAATANSGILNKIIDTQLSKFDPDNFKQIVSNISNGSPIGIDSIVSIFKSADQNGNIDEQGWKNLEQIALELSTDKAVRSAGLGTGYTTGQLSQTALKNINDLNNRKGRDIEEALISERSDVQQVLKKNSQPAESSLQAENQRNEIAAVAVSTHLHNLDLQSRSLTAQQIANANALKQRQEQLSQRRSEQIASKASSEEQTNLINIITRPYYGDK